MATYSSILDWRIPWMEEPGRLQFMGLQSQTQLSDFTFIQQNTIHLFLKKKEEAPYVLIWNIPQNVK